MYYRGHRRTNSNTSNISSISRVSYSSDHWLGMDRSTTPTNFLPQLPTTTSSQRSVAGSPAVSHEEDLREIIVLAENAKSDTLTCPLCSGVFRDPYIAACGVRPCNYFALQWYLQGVWGNQWSEIVYMCMYILQKDLRCSELLD